jgi:parallel beta-helix repeat protein
MVVLMGRYWRAIAAHVLLHNTYYIESVQVILILCAMALASAATSARTQAGWWDGLNRCDHPSSQGHRNKGDKTMKMDKPDNIRQYRTIRTTTPNALLRASVLMMVMLCMAVFVCGTAGAATIWVPEGGNQTIQQAVNNATAGDTIIVRDGTYNENVDVTKRLTIQSQNGSANCIVAAADLGDHVFEVTVDYVNISGFKVTGANDDWKAGVYLNGGSRCNVSDNTASGNFYGIYLYDSSNSNTLTSNNASSNGCYGIYLESSSNNTVTKNTASNNDYGIWLDYSSDNTLTNNTASDNYNGIWLSHSSYNTLTGNNCSGNDDGIVLRHSSNYNTLTSNNASNNRYGISLWWSSNNNTLMGNNASNNDYGIYLHRSSSNALTSNTMSGNAYNFYLRGNADSHFNNTINMTNRVDGKPIYYIKDNSSGMVIDNTSNAGTIYCIRCDNVTIKDLNLARNRHGVYFWKTTNSSIENVSASNNYNGIRLYLSCDNNTLIGNNCSGNDYDGIYLYSSSDNNTLTGNNCSGNYRGIILSSSSNNTLTGNNCSGNDYDGIGLYDSSDNTLTGNNCSGNGFGIWLQDSSDNTLTENDCSGNYLGIRLYSSSNNNTLTGNNCSGNDDGIYLGYSSDNNVSCNWVQNNTDAGIYLTSGSTGNTIKNNSIIANGVVQGDGSYRWQFANNQSYEVSTAYNWWGTDNTAKINASICDWTYDTAWGNVTTSPRLDGPAPCAPTQEPYAFTTADAVIALEIAVGSRPPNSRYDVSGDGNVTSLDALMILQASATGLTIRLGAT